MNDEEHVPALQALPTFSTVDSDSADIEFCFRRLRIGLFLDVSEEDKPEGTMGYYGIIGIFDESTSVATVSLSVKEFHRTLYLAHSESPEAAYSYVLAIYRTAKKLSHDRLHDHP